MVIYTAWHAANVSHHIYYIAVKHKWRAVNVTYYIAVNHKCRAVNVGQTDRVSNLVHFRTLLSGVAHMSNTCHGDDSGGVGVGVYQASYWWSLHNDFGSPKVNFSISYFTNKIDPAHFIGVIPKNRSMKKGGRILIPDVELESVL